MAHASGVVALLDTLTFPELMTILVVALVVLGPEKLPGMARTAGRWLHKAQQLSANLQEDMKDVIEDPAMQPIKELGEFAAQPRKKLSEYAAAAQKEAEDEAAAEAEAELARLAAERAEQPTDVGDSAPDDVHTSGHDDTSASGPDDAATGEPDDDAASEPDDDSADSIQ